MAQIAEIATIKSRETQTVPWPEIEPLLSQARQALGTSDTQVTHAIGYSGGNVSDWQKRGQAPLRAKYALIGMLADLRIERKHAIEKQFTHQELSRLFAALISIPLPEDQHKALVTKVAHEMTTY